MPLKNAPLGHVSLQNQHAVTSQTGARTPIREGSTRAALCHKAFALCIRGSLMHIDHQHAMIYCILYMSNTINRVISYSRLTVPLRIEAFFDSDWEANLDSRKSQSGSMFFLGQIIIHWAPTQQSLGALSTAEAEVYALKEIVKTRIWLKNIINGILLYVPTATVFCDNQAAILTVIEPLISKHNRHMSYHFIKSTLEKRNVRYVPSKQTSLIPARQLSPLRRSNNLSPSFSGNYRNRRFWKLKRLHLLETKDKEKHPATTLA